MGCLQRIDRSTPQEWRASILLPQLFLHLLAQQASCCEATVWTTTPPWQPRPSFFFNQTGLTIKTTTVDSCFNMYAHVSTFQHLFWFGGESTNTLLEVAVILMVNYYSHYTGLDLNTVAVLPGCFNAHEVIMINCRIICGSSTWRDDPPLWFPVALVFSSSLAAWRCGNNKRNKK